MGLFSDTNDSLSAWIALMAKRASYSGVNNNTLTSGGESFHVKRLGVGKLQFTCKVDGKIASTVAVEKALLGGYDVISHSVYGSRTGPNELQSAGLESLRNMRLLHKSLIRNKKRDK